MTWTAFIPNSRTAGYVWLKLSNVLSFFATVQWPQLRELRFNLLISFLSQKQIFYHYSIFSFLHYCRFSKTVLLSPELNHELTWKYDSNIVKSYIQKIIYFSNTSSTISGRRLSFDNTFLILRRLTPLYQSAPKYLSILFIVEFYHYPIHWLLNLLASMLV